MALLVVNRSKIITKILISLISLLTTQQYQKRMTMYPAEKPDYIKKWSQESDNKPTEIDRRKLYPVYTSPVRKPRDLIADKLYAIEWLKNETDEKVLLGKQFLNFLGDETVDKLFKNHIAPSERS